MARAAWSARRAESEEYPMPHPNEVLIQQLFDAYGRGDTAALRLQLAPDVEYELPGHSPMAGTYRGREEVLALWDRQKAYLGGKPYLVTRDGSVADDDGLVLLAAGEAKGPAGTLRWRAANVYPDPRRPGGWVSCFRR